MPLRNVNLLAAQLAKKAELSRLHPDDIEAIATAVAQKMMQSQGDISSGVELTAETAPSADAIAAIVVEKLSAVIDRMVAIQAETGKPIRGRKTEQVEQ